MKPYLEQCRGALEKNCILIQNHFLHFVFLTFAKPLETIKGYAYQRLEIKIKLKIIWLANAY